MCKFLPPLIRNRTGSVIRIALSSIGETQSSKERWFLPLKEFVKSHQFYLWNSSLIISQLSTPTATATSPMLFCSLDQEDDSPCCFPALPVCPLSNMLGVQDSENPRTTNERQKKRYLFEATGRIISIDSLFCPSRQHSELMQIMKICKV